MRYVWLICGAIALGLAIIGVVLPIMPTVPFLLLAAFCFSRSSPRLHDWLLSHPVYGPHITAWHESGAIKPRAKWLAALCIAGSLGLSAVLGVPNNIFIIQCVILTAVMIFIWSRPPA